MGTKRLSGEGVHPSRQTNIETRPSKRRRFDPTQPSSDSLSRYALKEKIRDLGRLLAHSRSLPADVRVEKERALAGYKADFEKLNDAKKRNDMISRYHMVRFFERQKATRALKKLKRKLSAIPESSTERESLEGAIHGAEVDLNYTIYFPLNEKYQSLYPRTPEQAPLNESEGQELGGRGELKTKRDKPPLWHMVELATAEGRLEALRDGQGPSLTVGPGKPSTANGAKSSTTVGKNVQGRGGGVEPTAGARLEENEDDDNSDGGFFEK